MPNHASFGSRWLQRDYRGPTQSALMLNALSLWANIMQRAQRRHPVEITQARRETNA